MLEWTTTLGSLSVGLVDTTRGPVEVARAGSGPAVLLVHGIPGSWRQAVPLAEDLAGEYELLLPSRPGYGRTPLRVGRTAAEQADAYAALLDAIGIDRCTVVGISGGGPSAVAFASRHPERCTGLVLACALAAHLMHTPRNRLLKVPGLAEALVPIARFVARRRLRRPEVIEAELRKGLTPDEFARSQSDPSIVGDIVRHFLSHQDAPPGLAGLRNDHTQVDRAHEAVPTNVSCPTLVLHGDADTVVPLEHARFHTDALGGQLVVYEQAGHLFLFTRRDESVSEIREFLAGIG